jgi:serine/threonine protein kinase/tetratricopeptide (TPR) repeat protein
MSSTLICVHGHSFNAESGTVAIEQLRCPLCGAAVKRLRDDETMAGALDVTFVPNSMRLPSSTGGDTATDANLDATMSPETSDGGQLESGSVDPQPGALAPTVDFTPQQLEEAERELAAAQNAAGKSKRKARKPPALSGIDVIEELGRGGFGVVYRAFDEKHSREVALKTLQRMGPDDLVRFKNEFRALADIAHPNLVSLYELLSDGRTWCFTMEILNGVNFLEYVWSEFESLRIDSVKARVAEPIKESVRLSMRRMNRLFDSLKQLVIGLNELHVAGKLHSDIKPSNVLVTTEGRVVLLDFGLIAEIQRDQEGRLPTVIQGTPHYMAPEQAACRPLTEASDWYAVGVMLYEVLTGRLPFRDTTAKAMLRKQYEVPVEPAKRQPGIPPELNKLCMALLEIDPDKRPSAADILRAVDAEELAKALVERASFNVQLTADLVGREDQLESLEQVFAETVEGHTRSVFIHGDSGMGKTVLIRSFLDRLVNRGETILLEGRCYQQESVPFKSLDSLIDALVVYLKSLPRPVLAELIPQDTLPLLRLFPVLGQLPGTHDRDKPTINSADQHELRTRAMAALRELLVRIGRRLPIVMHIDDLQWGDEDSSHLLADLLRPPDGPRLLLLGSYRRENADDSPALISLDEAYRRGRERPHRLDLPVDPLRKADAERLAISLLGGDDRATKQIAARIAGESGGSPFFVWELAQHVREGAGTSQGRLDLDEVIWSRVCRLPEETRRLLEVFSVAGRPMRASEAYETINVRTTGPGLLAQLRTSNFVRTAEAGAETAVETYHDRIRESVVNHLPAAKVRGHFLKLALVIEQSADVNLADVLAEISRTPEFGEQREPPSLENRLSQRIFDLAYFFDAAGKPERARPYALVAAAQASSQNALEVAEQQYEIARRGAEGADDATRFRIAEGLGEVLMMGGRYDRANQQFQMARSLANENVTLARIDGKRGHVSFKQGDMGNSVEHFERALTELGNPPPASSLLKSAALVKEAIIQMLHTYFPRWLTGRHRADSERGRMDLFRARLCDGLSYSYWFTQGPVPTLWTHLRHMNLAERYPPSLELGRAYAVHAVMMTAIPLSRRGVVYAERAFHIHGDMGDRLGQGKARSFKAFSLLALGRFQEGVETGREAIRLLEQAGDVWEANMARMIASFPMYFLGDLRRAHLTAKRSFEIAVETGDHAGMAIALYFWATSAPHALPEGALQAECERKRDDPLSSSAALQGRGLELLMREDNPGEAAVMIQKSLDLARQRGLRNACIFCGVTWKATALRMVAERAAEGSARQKALAEASKAVRDALRITRKYLTVRPMALRERGILAVLKGKEKEARRFFDRSLEFARQQEAAYEYAQTELARAEAGLKFGWPDAQQQLARARAKIAEIKSGIEPI